VRAYLDKNLPGQWIGRRGAVEFRPRSPGLIPLDFYIWEALKNVVYHRKLATLAVLWEEIETECAAIQMDTLINIAQAVRRNQKCLDADGNHFEHLL
jgi:hypothetical protein